MDHPNAGGQVVPLIASPLRFSGTPVTYRHPPPLLGEHTEEVLRECLGIGEAELTTLRAAGAI